MNPVPFILLAISLPLLLGGCGEKTVNVEELEEREGIYYLVGSDTPYTGKVFLFHEKGQKSGEINVKNGREDGLSVSWHENGQKKVEVNFKDGLQNGLAIGWYDNGQKESERNFKDGVEISVKYWNSKGVEGVNDKALEIRKGGIMYLEGSDTPYTGKVFLFHENGQKEMKGNYKDGKKDGLDVSWYENGQKWSETNWKDGKEDGLHVWWYDNGQKSMEQNYKKGWREGLFVSWHENGQKSSEVNYKDGKKEGLYVSWRQNGQKSGEINYKNDKREGLDVSWHENGQKWWKKNYKNGKFVEGSAKYWNRKGESVDSIEETFK